MRYFEKKDEPYRFCISEITDSERVVRERAKKSQFRRSFAKQHGKRAKPLSKSSSHYLYHIHWSLSSQLTWKNSLFFTWQMFGLPVNTLAADGKDPVLNRDNLTIPTETPLSPKEKTFSEFFAEYLESRWNFEHFWQKRWSS